MRLSPALTVYTALVMLTGCIGYETEVGQSAALTPHWQSSEIPLGTRVASQVAVGVDASGKAHLAIQTRQGLDYAVREGSSFRLTTLSPSQHTQDMIAVAMTSTGEPRVALHSVFTSPYDLGVHSLRFLRPATPNWVDEFIVNGANGRIQGFHFALAANDEIMGSYQLDGRLRYFGPVGTSVVTDEPDIEGESAVAMDGAGTPHLVAAPREVLTHFRWDGAGWRGRALDPDSGFAPRPVLATDPNGTVHLAYFRRAGTKRGLVHRVWNGTEWSAATVVQANVVGTQIRMSFDAQARTTLVYRIETVQSWNAWLVAVEEGDTGWTPTQLSNLAAPQSFDAVRDGQGRLVIALVAGGHVSLHENVATALPDPAVEQRWTGSVERNQEATFTTTVLPVGETLVELDGTGDADLYAQIGRVPTLTDYACRPFNSGTDEVCTIRLATPERLQIMVRGYAAGASTFTLRVVPPNAPPLPGPTDRDWTGSAAAGQEVRFSIEQAAAGTYDVIMTGTEDADLYVQLGQAPTTTSFACRPYLDGTNESCRVTLPTATALHAMVRGYRGTSQFTLKVRKQP